MTLQFENVFAGIGMGSREKKNDSLIDDLSIFIEKFAQAGVTRFGNITDNLQRQGFYAFAGNTHYTDAASSGRRSNRGNSVSIFHQVMGGSESANRRSLTLPEYFQQSRAISNRKRPAISAVLLFLFSRGSSGGGTLDHARDLPLLENGKHVIDQGI